MKLGFVSAILPELSLEDVLALAAAEGFAAVEVMCWPTGKAERRFAGVTHLDVASVTPESAAALRAACERHGVSISGLGYYPNPLDPDPAVSGKAVEHLRRVMDAAAALGDWRGEHVRGAGLDQGPGRKLAALPGNVAPVGAPRGGGRSPGGD